MMELYKLRQLFWYKDIYIPIPQRYYRTSKSKYGAAKLLMASELMKNICTGGNYVF